MQKVLQLLKFLIFLSIFSVSAVVVALSGVYLYLNPQLPSVSSLRNIQYQIPLRVYSADEKLIAEFGEKRRTPITFAEIPQSFIDAAVAAEDQSFFEHSGVDIKGLTRAVKLLIQNKGEIKGGGSTITMQLAKVIFLTSEQTFIRKFKQIILALQIENELNKQEILELYFNVNFLGKRAYGIQAAAQVYYNRTIDQLSIAEHAMIAGLPKAPSAYNPVINPSRALERRNWILGRMLALGYIDQATHDEQVAAPITASYHGLTPEVEGPYIAELARKHMFETYGEDAYTQGFKVITTVDSSMQNFANDGVRSGIHSYDERHGYRGHLAQLELPPLEPATEEDETDLDQAPHTQQEIEVTELETQNLEENPEIETEENSLDTKSLLKPFRNVAILEVFQSSGAPR